MSNFVGASKTIVIRTSRDTLGLVVAASAMTFAMAYAVHSKHERTAPPPQPAPEARLQVPQQDWAGHLADVAPTSVATPSEPLSSAALVVPKSQLALPPLPVRLPVRRPCLDAACPPKTVANAPDIGVGATTAKRIFAATPERAREKPKKTLIGMLNPLNHLPDMAAVGKPFTYAGSTVAGWFKRL